MVTPKAGMNAMKSPRPVREETFGKHFIWYPSSYIIVYTSTKGWRGCNLELSLVWPVEHGTDLFLSAWRLELGLTGLSDIGNSGPDKYTGTYAGLMKQIFI